MRTIFLHMGYHKTATTFLQKSIFPKMKQVNYIKLRRIKPDLRRIRLRKLSDLEIENLRNYFNSYDNGQPMLISYEGLSGSPFSPKKRKRPLKILKDFRRIFPASDYDVHVMIGIREQVDLLTSLYVQQLHQGGFRDARSFIERCEKTGSLENFHFHKYLQQIHDIFGEDHAYVMIYEYFKQHFSEEMLKLLNYMGEPEIPPLKEVSRNKSYGTMQAAIALRLNRLFKTKGNPKGPLPVLNLPKIGEVSVRRLLQNKYSFAFHYRRYELPEDLKVSLKQRYAEGNKKLEENYNLKLPDKYFTSEN